jgi:hypothetical protein
MSTMSVDSTMETLFPWHRWSFAKRTPLYFFIFTVLLEVCSKFTVTF